MLKENPTTGYIWQVIDSDLEKNGLTQVLKMKGSQFAQDENRRGAVGVGGVRTMQFQAVGKGEGNLNLYHGRSWEI